MKIKSEKNKILITIIFFGISISGIIFLLLIPTVKKVYEQKDLLQEEKLIFERDQQNLEKYRNHLVYMEEELKYDEKLKINQDNEVELIELLEQIALDNNLILKIETFVKPISKKSKKGEADNTFLKLILTGEYRDLLIFIYKLENFTNPVDIESLTIKSFEQTRKNKQQEDIQVENLPEVNSELIISF